MFNKSSTSKLLNKAAKRALLWSAQMVHLKEAGSGHPTVLGSLRIGGSEAESMMERPGRWNQGYKDSFVLVNQRGPNSLQKPGAITTANR